MRPVPPLSLSVKLFAAFVFFFLVTTGLGAVAMLQLDAVNAGARRLQDNWLPSTRALGDIGYSLSELRTAEGASIMAASAEEAAEAEADLARIAETIDAAQAAYEALPRSTRESALYAVFLERWGAYRAALDRVLAASRDDKAKAAQLYRTDSRSAYEAASRTLEELADFNVAGGIRAAIRSEREYHRGLKWIIGALLAQAVLVVVATAVFARAFVRPIVRLTAVMTALADRGAGIRPPYLRRRDEIGSMARSIEVFRRNAVELEHSRGQLATQASRLQDALAREREIVAVQRNFVAMASHEFRTPLTVIDGQARRLLKRRDLMTPEELAERVGKIRNAAGRLTRAMDGFFRMARTPEGQIPYEPADCALGAILEEAAAAQAAVAESRRIEIDLGGLPQSVTADPALLRQVFDNLLDNAVKYSPPDSVVSVTGGTEAGFAVVTVADRGIGLPERDRERLFERYYRADNTGGVPGTGVGLHIVRVLVELHGGTVTAANREGGGSVFTVRLPTAPAPATGARAA